MTPPNELHQHILTTHPDAGPHPTDLDKVAITTPDRTISISQSGHLTRNNTIHTRHGIIHYTVDATIHLVAHHHDNRDHQAHRAANRGDDIDQLIDELRTTELRPAHPHRTTQHTKMPATANTDIGPLLDTAIELAEHATELHPRLHIDRVVSYSDGNDTTVLGDAQVPTTNQGSLAVIALTNTDNHAAQLSIQVGEHITGRPCVRVSASHDTFGYNYDKTDAPNITGHASYQHTTVGGDPDTHAQRLEHLYTAAWLAATTHEHVLAEVLGAVSLTKPGLETRVPEITPSTRLASRGLTPPP